MKASTEDRDAHVRRSGLLSVGPSLGSDSSRLNGCRLWSNNRRMRARTASPNSDASWVPNDSQIACMPVHGLECQTSRLARGIHGIDWGISALVSSHSDCGVDAKKNQRQQSGPVYIMYASAAAILSCRTIRWGRKPVC